VSSRLGYRPALDGLRAIAILLVVGIHAFGWPAGGQLGVDLFFVLSGFLITTLLLQEQQANGRVSLRAFFARRSRRLLPALAVLLAVFVVAEGATREATVTALLGAGFSLNIVRAWDLTHTSNALAQLWSLAAEDQFYLLWPALLFVVAGGRRLLAAPLLVAALVAMTADASRFGVVPRAEFGPDIRPTGLLIGCLVALAWTHPVWRRRLRRVCNLMLPVAGFSFLLLVVAAPGRMMFSVGVPVFSICGAVLLVCALEVGRLSRALSWRPLVGLGLISYSLYLWHLPLLVWTGSEGKDDVTSALAVGGAVVVAALSYRFVEQPFRRRRRQAGMAPAVRCAADGRGRAQLEERRPTYIGTGSSFSPER
jgi:peptidoglycan/LPS O-acetylase OafA/YrhL